MKNIYGILNKIANGEINRFPVENPKPQPPTGCCCGLVLDLNLGGGECIDCKACCNCTYPFKPCASLPSTVNIGGVAYTDEYVCNTMLMGQLDPSMDCLEKQASDEPCDDCVDTTPQDGPFTFVEPPIPWKYGDPAPPGYRVECFDSTSGQCVGDWSDEPCSHSLQTESQPSN